MNTINTVRILEQKIKNLTIVVFILGGLFLGSLFFQMFEVDVNDAKAQSGYVIAPPDVPEAVEAQSFVLKDKFGNVRGIWSAEEKSTTFATSYRRKQPFISMNVDDSGAVLTISDDKNNQIFLASDNKKGPSLTMGNIHNPSHNILLGYSPEETNFELISRGSSRIGVSGREVLVEAMGKSSDFVVADRAGNYINISTDSIGGKISFVDPGDYENIRIEHVDGESVITILSPALKSKRVITADVN